MRPAHHAAAATAIMHPALRTVAVETVYPSCMVHIITIIIIIEVPPPFIFHRHLCNNHLNPPITLGINDPFSIPWISFRHSSNPRLAITKKMSIPTLPMQMYPSWWFKRRVNEEIRWCFMYRMLLLVVYLEIDFFGRLCTVLLVAS